MRNNRFNRNQSGFTLMESMIGSIILALVLVSLLALASHCFRYLMDIRRTARATQVLQQKMEDIRLLSWSQLTTINTSFVDSNAVLNTVFTGRVFTNSYDSYLGTSTVMQVTLQLTWLNRTGTRQTNTLSTVIANGGLNRYIF
jgi:prepilin-type N-terminal cleavage/methylation domain-containing protein